MGGSARRGDRWTRQGALLFTPLVAPHASHQRVRPRRARRSAPVPVPVVAGGAGVRLHHEQVRLNRVVSVVAGRAASERVGVPADVVVTGEAERVASLPHRTRIPAVLVRVADGAVVSSVRREGLRPERERPPRASVVPHRPPRRRHRTATKSQVVFIGSPARILLACPAQRSSMSSGPAPRTSHWRVAQASLLPGDWPGTPAADPDRPTPGRRAPCPGGRGRSRERGEAPPSG